MTEKDYVANALAKKINDHFFGRSYIDIDQSLKDKGVQEGIDKTLLSRIKTATYTSLGPTTKAFKAFAKYFDKDAPAFWEELKEGYTAVEEKIETQTNGIRLGLPSFTVWSTILVNPLLHNWPDYLKLCVHKSNNQPFYYDKDTALELWNYNVNNLISSKLWEEQSSPFEGYQFSTELMQLLASDTCNAIVMPQWALESQKEEDNGVFVLPNGEEIVPIADIAEGYGALLCLLYLKEGELSAADQERGYSIEHYNVSEMLSHEHAAQVALECIKNGYDIEEALVYANLDTFKNEIGKFDRNSLIIRHMRHSTTVLQWEKVVEQDIKIRFPEIYAKLSRIYDRTKIDLTDLSEIEEKLVKPLNEGKIIIYTSPAPFVHNLCQVARFKIESGKHIHIVRWNLSQWYKQKQSFVLYMRKDALSKQNIENVIHYLNQVESTRNRINADLLHKYSFFTNIQIEDDKLLVNDIEPIELYEKAIQELQITDTPIKYTAQFVKFLSSRK